jgi:hypothetical protein
MVMIRKKRTEPIRTKEWNEKIRKSNKKTWSKESTLNKIRGENNPEGKLKTEDVIFIYKEGCKRKNHIEKYGQYASYDGYNYNELANMFNISKTMVQYIVNHKLWSHVTKKLK